MSSDRYDGSSAQQRLADIANSFRLIHDFIGGSDRDEFLADKKQQYAVVRALEEACEAALWFTKHENGADIRTRHPSVNFRRFGDAGNVFRHQYGGIQYDRIWDDIIYGSDIAQMELLLEAELPDYKRQLSRSDRL